MIITPSWKDKPDMVGMFWCSGVGEYADTFEVARVIKQDGKLFAVFPGKAMMADVNGLADYISRWWGPLTLADYEACCIFENGLYKPGQTPQEPLEKPTKSAKRSQKRGKNSKSRK